MNKKNLELLNLTEGATKEEITASYEALKAKYSEERFMDGEIGNNAAKMLTKIDIAYKELLNEFAESSAAEDEDSAYSKVEECIRTGDYQEAQRILDAFNERGAKWHYLQSVVFFRKNWLNESKKQLEIAIQLDPENEKYKETYKKLNANINENTQKGQDANGSVYEGQTINSSSDEQMGGNFCANCIQCCFINMCVNCLCNSCCR